jgi:hypothetical protein
MGSKNLFKKISNNYEEVEEDPPEQVKKSKSTPKLAQGMSDRKKSYRESRERYIHN